MSEFKGTTEEVINDYDFIAVASGNYAVAKVYTNAFISKEQQEQNANLIIDAFKVRQQINIELSELKEQRDEMLQMLEEVHYTLENEGFTETRNNMQQLIKKVKNE